MSNSPGVRVWHRGGKCGCATSSTIDSLFKLKGVGGCWVSWPHWWSQIVAGKVICLSMVIVWRFWCVYGHNEVCVMVFDKDDACARNVVGGWWHADASRAIFPCRQAISVCRTWYRFETGMDSQSQSCLKGWPKSSRAEIRKDVRQTTFALSFCLGQ